jgi:hypothetical protein
MGKDKVFRLWAYHSEWIPCGANFAVLPPHRTPAEMRLLRRAERKAARRRARKGKA